MNNKPKCVLVDDEETSLAALRSAIEEIGLLEVERAYLDAERFLLQISDLEACIVFLDMEMPFPGDECAAKLRHKQIIFVSGHRDLAWRAFDVAAVDFVQKPIRLTRLKEAIEKVLKLRLNEEIYLKTQDAQKQLVRLSEVVYIESARSDARDKRVVLASGIDLIAKNINFRELMQLINAENIIQANPSQLVNLNYVNRLLDADSIGVMVNGKSVTLNLGDKFKEEFFKAKPNFRK